MHTHTHIIYLLSGIRLNVRLVLNCRLTVEASVTGSEEVKTVLCESVVWSLRLFDVRCFLGFRHTLSFSYLTNEKTEVELNCPLLKVIGSRSHLKMCTIFPISVSKYIFLFLNQIECLSQ